MIRNLVLTVIFSATAVQAEVFSGVEFPNGAVSFADKVVSYTAGANVSAPYNSPENIIGKPDYISGGVPEHVALGDGGEIIVQFTDNSLTASGDDSDDLWVFEIGAKLEPTAIYVSEDGNAWVYVGETTGGVGGVDIDKFVGSGVELGVKYSYVKIIDLLPTQSGAPWAGADIDAVGVISSDVGVCGDISYTPASYNQISGKLTIPYVVSEGKCYELELNAESLNELKFIENYSKSSISQK